MFRSSHAHPSLTQYVNYKAEGRQWGKGGDEMTSISPWHMYPARGTLSDDLPMIAQAMSLSPSPMFR